MELSTGNTSALEPVRAARVWSGSCVTSIVISTGGAQLYER